MAKKILPSSVQIQKLAEDKKLLSNLEKRIYGYLKIKTYGIPQ